MKKVLSLLLVLLIALSLACCDLNTPIKLEREIEDQNVKLKVHFIDVGQGDSILLESGGEFALIDAGEKEYGSTVLKYIKSRGADSLKYMIATHPHSDHVGGLTKVINGIDVQNFFAYETDHRTSTWLKVLKAVDKNDVNYIDAKVGDKYKLGSATFTFIAPLSDDYGSLNDMSIVTMVQCGKIRFLLTGDAEKQSEKDMLASGTNLKADVLKLGHHGSSTSSTAAFLKAVKPSYAIISVATINDYGHPHKETLKKLDLMGCPYMRTDEVGTIVASTDGTYLSFKTERGKNQLPTYSADNTTATEATYSYIGNKNSKIFHYEGCTAVEKMSEKNKVDFDSREEAVSAGYEPCGMCEP